MSGASGDELTPSGRRRMLARLLRHRAGRARLSYSQERLWFLHQLVPNMPVYNVPVAVRLEGDLDAGVLERSLGEIVARHEVLRTRFEQHPEGPLPIVDDRVDLRLERLDLSDEPAALREEMALERANEEARRPFDLERSPLLRALLLRLSEDDHLLVLTLHHIVAEGWSVALLFGELERLYAASIEGKPSPLEALPIQYGDYAFWQRERSRGEALTSELDYWCRELGGKLPVIELPSDRTRPLVQTFGGAWQSRSLAPELRHAASALAQSQGATLFMVLLAAFQALLERYTDQQDILVGSPIAGRNRTEAEQLIGVFINTLVMRTDLSGDPTFGELLGRVRETAVGAFSHQEIPFEQVVEKLEPDRHLSHTPIFQVMFAMQNTPLPALELTGLAAGRVLDSSQIHNGTTKVDLAMFVEEAGDGLKLGCEYSTDLFDAETIERLLGHYEVLLAAAVEDPECRLSRLGLLTEPERRQLLVDWNDTATPYPDSAVHQLFEQQVAERGDAVAVVCGDTTLSYAELDQQANQLARFLIQCGVRTENRVGVCLERSPDLLVTLIAVLKTGGAYLPLDPSYPRQRLAFMLEDAGAELVLTQEGLLDSLPQTEARIVCLDRDRDLWAEHGTEPLELTAHPDQLAYVIYTSGSTGKPKGTNVPHRAVVRLVRQTDYASFSPDEVFLQMAPIAFDASTFEIWGPLLNGARLAIYPPETPSLDALASFIEQHEVTTLWLTAALFHQMVDQHPEAFAKLRQLVAGGDVLDPARVRTALDHLEGGSLVNGYGPTENTTFTCCQVMSRADEVGTTVSIGKPIRNTRVYVLDPKMSPVPSGIPGELHIAGDGLARDYLGSPRLTAERFVPDPFATTPGARLYRSGDLVRYRVDGRLEFLGREDFQVKVRGFRVELGEIEAALAASSEVRESVVLARDDMGEDKRIVAYVVPTQPDLATPEKLRSLLAAHLPDHMVPSVFVPLDELPVLPNGKIDRSALPAPSARPVLERSYDAPRNQAESTIADIWREALSMDRVGRDDNFFDLGGHSLLLVMIHGMLRERFDTDLTMVDMFRYPTVAALARHVANDRKDVGAARQIGGSSAERRELLAQMLKTRAGRARLSYSQERLWFLHQLVPNMPVYNVPVAVRLEGDLDAGVLERSLGEIVARHEVLRTRFEQHPEGPLPIVDDRVDLRLERLDLSDEPAALREEMALERANEEARRPFDLERSPLLRALLLRLSEDDHLLVLTLHHIVAEGWSVALLFGELERLYAASIEGKPSPLEALPIQYGDYAFWQRERSRGEALTSELDYWCRELGGKLPVIELPSDRTRPLVQTFGGAWQSRSLAPELRHAASALAQSQGATLFMVLLAAFQALLERYTDQQDILVGSPIAGRNRTEAEQLIGVFINTLVMRTDLSGDPTFGELLGRVRETAVGAFSHQEIPFEQVVEKLEPDRHLSHTPIFQVMFAMQNTPLPALELTGLAAGRVLDSSQIHNGTTKVDLAMFVEEAGDGLKLGCEYSTDLFDAETIERLLGHYEVLLAAAVEDPECRLSRLGLLTEPERRQLLVDWNDTATPYPDSAVHQLFEQQVAERGDAVAVVCGDTTLSYAELDQQANQLARFLIQCGVRTENRVGVCLERSPDLLVTLIAVLKTGGAYLPLDPSYPRQRLAFMLEDAGAELVLTQEGLLDSLPQAEARIVCLDRDRDLWAGHSTEPLELVTHPDQMAYVIYTSGSTGKPKGVEIEHRGLANLVHWHNRTYSLRPGDRGTQLAGLSFDASVWETWPHLAAGATLYIVGEETRLSPDAVVEFFAVNEITMTFVPTPLAETLLERQWPDETVLRNLLAGGSRLHLHAVEGAPYRLVNHYGPTENSVVTTSGLVEAASNADRLPSIGTPISNHRVYILDRQLRLVPIGVPGEIYVAGRGLARCYHGLPQLTAASFIPNPFGTAGGRLYATGDDARHRADGSIEFLGRHDGQIKLRGYRIELGEIESVLRSHQSVHEAVVVPSLGSARNVYLTAYVTSLDRAPLAADELRSFLRHTLPDYMIPAVYSHLESMPLTPNGKIDRDALPQAEEVEVTARASHSPPQRALERKVVKLWRDILPADNIGLDDSFFELGGHSLMLVEVHSRLSEIIDCEVSVVDLFRYPTISSLVAHIESRVQGADRLAATPAGGSATGEVAGRES